MSIAFDDMEKFATIPDTGKPAKNKETPPAPPKKADEPPAPPKPSDESPPAGDDDTAPPASAGDKKPTRTAELRTAYEKTKLERDELKAKLEATTSRLKEFEGQDITGAKARVEELQKRSDELEQRLKFTDYQQSQEFKEKYEKPFMSAYATGRAKVKGLKVITADGEQRAATEADFDSIVRIPDDEQAAELAAEMFGNKAPLVLFHRERVWEANQAMNTAVEEFKKNGSEHQKQTQEQMQKANEHRNALWKQHNEAAAEKFPQFFKPVEGDDAGNELLRKGYELADLAFSSEIEKLPPEKAVAIHASIRNRAAAFGRLAHQNKGLQEKVKSLEAELAKFKASEPGAGDGKAVSGSEAPQDSWAAAESALEKRARPA